MINNVIQLIRAHPVTSMFGMFVTGILFWGAFNLAMESTNTLSFCISCHEMRDTVFEEYQTSSHYVNATGVQAACPDCHVPRDWTHKVVRKVKATNELYHHFTGSIDTQEKFAAKRHVLARSVWDTMQATDSRECRNCHDFEHMDMSNQATRSAIFHGYATDKNLTCIDCHKGIAHRLPDGYQDTAFEATLDNMHNDFEQVDMDCGICHQDLKSDGGWYD